MTVGALLADLVAALGATKVPFMLTGSFAAAVHGAGRATMDLDFVIDPSASALGEFVQRMLDAGRYVSTDAAAEALATRGLFNVVDVDTGWKVDLIIRKDRPFSRVEFERRQSVAFGDVALHAATVEDLVLAKLEWASLGGSARQLEDVRALLRLAGAGFDRAYVERWVVELGVEAGWRRVQDALGGG